jgi:hypothetical protein
LIKKAKKKVFLGVRKPPKEAQKPLKSQKKAQK